MSVVIPDISPAELLDGFRGEVTDAHPAYPETIHLEVRDADGGVWRFATHDADYSPSDPDALCGRTVVSADLDRRSGNLTIGFSDGTYFRVSVEPPDAADDPVNWRLYTPRGLVLTWGPGANWQLRRGSDPI